MSRHWTAREDSLEIKEMPFYWRLTDHGNSEEGILGRMPIRIRCLQDLDLLEYQPAPAETAALEAAYRQDANIGFLNPESGQIATYGASVNRFFLDVVNAHRPRRIYEIGCGAGFSIGFLKEHGWKVTGIDPSEYSLQWSERLGFTLLNTFFDGTELVGEADFIYCNDVFEHISNVGDFAARVWRALAPGGVFCFATTNSTRSIELGDISMLEHQHVNMFTERSIRLILAQAGFGLVDIRSGSYGNTFQVVALKGGQPDRDLPAAACQGFFARAERAIEAFAKFHAASGESCGYYVPLRCIPYLAAVGDFGTRSIFDSNPAWRGKYIDGYGRSISAVEDIPPADGRSFFVGSLTFFEDIRCTLRDRGYADENIFSIARLDGMVAP
jgi:SAM-dependent methyltransferase